MSSFLKNIKHGNKSVEVLLCMWIHQHHPCLYCVCNVCTCEFVGV